MISKLEKRIEVTKSGFTALRRALPIAIDVQRRLFGDAGRPGGALLTDAESRSKRSVKPRVTRRTCKPARGIRRKFKFRVAGVLEAPTIGRWI